MSNENQTLVSDDQGGIMPATLLDTAEVKTDEAQVELTAFQKSMAAAKIDRELAMAIGHNAKSVFNETEASGEKVWVITENEKGEMDRFHFDHTDPRVIWPLAAHYDCFPYKTSSGGWTTNLLAPSKENMDKGVSSPEMAVALTIIQEYGL